MYRGDEACDAIADSLEQLAAVHYGKDHAYLVRQLNVSQGTIVQPHHDEETKQ